MHVLSLCILFLTLIVAVKRKFGNTCTLSLYYIAYLLTRFVAAIMKTDFLATTPSISVLLSFCESLGSILSLSLYLYHISMHPVGGCDNDDGLLGTHAHTLCV